MRAATEDWLASAQDDLETVGELIDNDQLTHIIAFHVQQCVEKSFKALLEEREERVPNIHNLVTLLAKVDESLSESVDEDLLERLNQLYIEARYPGERGLLPEGKPSQDEAYRFYQFAQSIHKQIQRVLQDGDEK
ncbi:HEPN domain-containing protein [Salinibacter sp.]|uniref:HEPN domain-containing protein n=1 Tax=Salinibacter sp. TaxID=2065818 RepID=UPI0021E87E7A|nr:HEPN domain-containing protein [Salinibacter sp.]